jgi:hypothetical protein
MQTKANLSVRVDARLHDAIRRRAKATGETVSAVVRRILEDALAARPLATRVGHLRGALDLPRPARWRESLRRRNWRR